MSCTRLAPNSTDGGPRGQPILDDQQALLIIFVEVLRFAHLLVPDDAVDLEETILGVGVVFAILGLREHHLSVVMDREVATCKGKKDNSQLKLKTKDGRRKRREMVWKNIPTNTLLP